MTESPALWPPTNPSDAIYLGGGQVWMKLNLYSKKSVESQTVKMVYFCRHGLAHVERALSIGPGFGGSGVCRLQLQG